MTGKEYFCGNCVLKPKCNDWDRYVAELIRDAELIEEKTSLGIEMKFYCSFKVVK
jgi:hypothetical protein